MGQKVNPISLRLGINKTWDSRWFSEKEYPVLLHQDYRLRDYVLKAVSQASISKVIIERPAQRPVINVHSARPGVLIGKKGADIDKLKKKLSEISGTEVVVNIIEERKPEIVAKLVADGVAQQIERRVTFRRAMKRAIQSAMRLGAEGIRINCAGRLGGAEIARTEWYREGRVPLHTLRSEIDYALSEAHTTYGVIGIKVWIYTGDSLQVSDKNQESRKI